MRVAFLIEGFGGSGGMATIHRHARHLVETEGIECCFVVCGPKARAGADEAGGLPVLPLAEAGAVDVAVATWWTTAEALYELDAARRVIFLQSLEHRFYPAGDRSEAVGALGALELPVDFIAISSHIRRLLERLRPEARCHVVPVGIDKQVFAPRETAANGDGPLRVLVEGQASLWFKGVADAVAAVRAMSEPATLTLVMPDAGAATGLDADRVVGGVSPEEMAALYAEHDVLLKLSRLEGLGLPPLEAMHVGRPCVITPFTGSDDYARHGENALVVGIDDHPGTVAALDLLARDAELRRRLAAGALATTSDWPDHATSARGFAQALRAVCEEPPAATEPALRKLMRSRRLAIELGRQDAEQLRLLALQKREQAEGYDSLIADYFALAEERLAAIHELTGRPSYRAAHLAKRLTRRPNPW